MNLLQTITSSILNKSIIILLYYACVMFSLLPLRILYFPCYVEVSWILNKNVFKKNPKDFSKHIVSDGQMELILKHKCTFIWCSYHFNTPFCVILQYPQSEREILCQKQKQYLVKLHDFFFLCILCRTYFLSLISYQRGITMNISNT